ncbi:hypothetical protein LshimejAT787_1500740 [Lyophyllum shimeji]|uniref:Uncharacterized protein n=1 Tax=Lyophyllum shimeji TaxID=47721 RepID=A0A9P3PVU4_LYOSH|nr:hypothetical protein LshimejAT787_1500740 [Lyophyllum shimeji]
MKMARKRDSSGLEAKRRKAQVEFDWHVAELAREKEAEKVKQAAEEEERIRRSITLITDRSLIDDMKIKALDEQLDAL